MDIVEAINRVVEHHSLSTEDMAAVMQQIMTGGASEAQIAGFLVALRMKGESVDELTGAVQVMRELMTPVSVSADHMVDIVGTGGDGAGIFNVSTASAVVAAAGGAHVAKHGNRSVSSKSGAADLLEAAGVNLDISAEQVAACIENVGFGFMFAVNHHSAMKHAIGPRKQLATRTIFNLLGPMTNPAGVKRQLLGVYAAKWQRPVAEVLRALGSEHVMVVHSEDGLDEISIAAHTHVVELKDGELSEYQLRPEQFGFKLSPLDSLKVADAQESLALIQSVLAGEPSAAADTVALNAGAALYVAGVADSLAQGIDEARLILSSGKAAEKLAELASYSQGLKNA